MTIHSKTEVHHYDGLAENYEDAWFFDDGYLPWVAEKVTAELDLQPDDAFVDIGGGTGNDSIRIAKEAGLKEMPLIVDNSAGMVQEAIRKGLKGINLDAESFSKLPDQRYNKGMLKETIHHLKAEERKSFLSGIAKQLLEGGRFAVLTRPPRPQFPFFEAALDVFEAGQESGEVFREEMKSAGFKKVELKNLHYTMQMDKKSWIRKLNERFMSILSTSYFSEEQLQEGIKEVEEKYKDVDVIEFDEIFVTLIGYA